MIFDEFGLKFGAFLYSWWYSCAYIELYLGLLRVFLKIYKINKKKSYNISSIKYICIVMILIRSWNIKIKKLYVSIY